ncbi:MAG: cation-translocating P-type ATPase [Ramlibacter sp.]|nr:cation-translocating P-type ATPase [Ramlibacter sp.]
MTAGSRGLSAAQVQQRLQLDGPNELAPPQRRTAWHSMAEVAREPMFQLLLAAGLVYLVLGSLGEAAMLLAFVMVTVGITVVQAQRSENSLAALREMASPRALVLRDGTAQRIAGRDVVRGDLLLLREGDRIAADAQLLSANDLQVDESLLTGEALPVAKAAAAAGAATRIEDAIADEAQTSHLVFAGTMVVAGGGVARVVATGVDTEFGHIGKALGDIATPPTPLTLQTRRLVKVFSVLGLGLSALVVLLYGLQRGDWTGGLLAGITLAMALLPEELLLVLTVFMAIGAWRLSRQRVLTRRAATIEALGAATVLCTDKTGTLTLNHMAIAELATPGEGGLQTWAGEPAAPPAAFHELIEFGMRASEPQPFDPMDKAFMALGVACTPPVAWPAEQVLVHEIGLSAELPAMTHVWQAPGNPAGTVAVKGAHEAVATLCRMTPAQAGELTNTAQAMANRGLRVLAVARAEFEGRAWPATPQGFDWTFLGLVALADPLRPGVTAAVQECRSAGIRVVMITGDHPATAQAIAAQAGLATHAEVVSGAQLAAMGDAELRLRVATTSVFARVVPNQKLRIVAALQANGQVVGMTGDGVNDAPSLKAAHIGIAMGARGTDVAREASSLVLMDDDFGAIVGAVRLGRRIYDNLRKAMAFTFAVHVPIAGLSLLPLLLGWPTLFTPVHIAFLELMINPVCAFVFESEAEESDVMTRPPRNPAAPLFSTALVVNGLLQGTLVLALVAGFYGLLLADDVAAGAARAAAFTALVACTVALIVANRSFSPDLLHTLRRPNQALWRVLGATAAMLGAVLLIAPVRQLFGFAPLPVAVLAAALGLGLAALLLIKLVVATRPNARRTPTPA